MTSFSRIACVVFLCTLASLLTNVAIAQDSLVIGANVNMVSGDSFPNGDPFLRQQNEPSVAFSSRNSLHLLSGANDYRAVDVPGLPGGRETGDSWLSYFWSTNGGATWKSTLIPGYPQDPDCQGPNPPTLCGYAAGADPVVRAGVNGMFYYSGIVFERGDPSRSAIFVSRFIDLNNDEGGDPIRFLDTVIIDANNDGAVFLDKSWIGVDIPRSSVTDTFSVVQRGGSNVDQTVACGNVYVGYAAIGGEEQDLRSEIRLATSADCGNSWDIQPISQPDSLNQGANIAIHPLTGELNVVWRRFDTVESFLGISPTGCPASPASWKINSDWPVSTITMAGVTYTIAEAQALLGTKHRGDESIKLAYEVIAAKLNLLTGGGDPVAGFNAYDWSQNLTGLITDAEAWFVDNPIGSNPKQQDKKAGQNIKKGIQAILQGSGTCSDAGSGTDAILTATGETNAIMVASSFDFGDTFSEPVVIDEASTFDQGSTRFSFRTTAYPTVAADANGRIYVAWAARGYATIRGEQSDGDARIVVSTSNNGIGWSAPYAIDEPNRNGHQIKPSMLFAGGQLTMVYYDFRQDVSNVFEGFVVDLPEPDRLRHTVDVRVATALPDVMPVFTDYSLTSVNEPVNPSDSASRYNFVAYGDASSGETIQVEYMVPNFPMFADGTTPFIGDYVDIAAPNLINENGTWRFASNPGDVQVWQAVWSDNRDVIPPPDGDWSKYVAPIADARTSLFDPTVIIPSCYDISFPDSDYPDGSLYTGTRNQNVYSASISNGVIIAAPGNNRPLGLANTGSPLERGFVIYVQNTTSRARNFRLSLPTMLSGVEASFAPNQVVTMTDIEIPPYSSAVATVFATGTASTAIPVSVDEVGGTLTGSVYLNNDSGAPGPLDTSLLASEVHNPAILNPAILNPAILNASVSGDDFMSCTADPAKCVLNPAIFNPAIMNPAILNPAIFNPAIMNPAIFNPAILNPAIFNPAIMNPAIMNPAIMNPAILNPAILNPAIFNPAIFNPAILNPAIMNPAIMNPAILNPAILNPAILNPAIFNPAILNPAILNPAILNTTPGATPEQVDVTFAIRNDGNATTAYDLNLAAPQLEGLDYDVVVYRLNETPVAQGCELTTEAQQQLIFNQTDPLNETVDGSFYLEPGQEVLVTFTVRPDVEADTPADPVTTFDADDLFGVVSSQPVNTDPITQPPPLDQFGPPASCEISGDWLGTYVQPGFSPYPIALTNLVCGTPGSVIANVEYPSLGCSGTWTLNSMAGSTMLITETVSGGTCVPVVDHEVVALDADALSGFTPAYNSTFSLSRTGDSIFTETVITGDADILNDGTLIAANDLGGNPSAVTVNGVTFGTDQGGLSNSWGLGGGDFSVDPLSANLDALLSDLQFSGTLNPVSLTIGGLTPGVDYRLQLLFSNDVNFTGDRVEVTVEGETWILDDWRPDAINLTANFTASGPSVVVTFAPAAGSTSQSGRAVLNAYAIHAETFTVTSFDPSVVFSGTSPAQQVALDAAVGITDDLIEDFEDLSLVPGLTLSGGAFGLNSQSAFPNAIWDGTNYYVDQAPTGNGVTFNIAGGTSSFGIGLGDIDSANVNLFVNGQDLGSIMAQPNWVKLGDNVRDVYLRVDAAPGESITSVRIEQSGSPGSGDGIFFDRVAIDPLLGPPPLGGPQITAVTPNPMAPGFGQMATFTIINAPPLDAGNGDVVFARNDGTGVTTSTSNFVFTGKEVRLDGALRPATGTQPGTVWVEYGSGERSNDFAMTFSSIPGAPVITQVSSATACLDFSGAVIDPLNDTVLGGDWLYIGALGLDSNASRIDVLTTQASSAVNSTAGLCGFTSGPNYWVQIPAGVTAAPFTLEVRANQTSVGGGPGDYVTIDLNQ